MKTLLFKNFVQHKGLNTTIRNGRKWFDLVKPGDKVNLESTNGPEIGCGRIFSVALVENIDQVSDMWIEYNARANTRESLAKAMDTAYGEGNWGGETTIIAYIVE